MGFIHHSGCIKADMGSQIAPDNPYPFPALFILVACNTFNHVVAINCHLMDSYFFEFVYLLRVGSVL